MQGKDVLGLTKYHFLLLSIDILEDKLDVDIPDIGLVSDLIIIGGNK